VESCDVNDLQKQIRQLSKSSKTLKKLKNDRDFT